MTDRDKKAGTLRLHCTKSKDSAPPNETWFKLHEVQLGIDHLSGKVLTGVVLVSTEAVEKERTPKLGSNEKLAHAVLKELLDVVRANELPDLSESTSIDQTLWSKECRDRGLDSKAFYKSKTTLLEKGIVVVDTLGRVTLG
jgi:hypothetical protein